MMADQETNVVLVADTLELEFPAVYSRLSEILKRHEIPLRTIPGTRSIWCRDYMPIQVAEDRFVQFRYNPAYLTGKYRRLRADGEIGARLPWIRNCVRPEIVLDGGNVVAWSDRVIVTEKVLSENPCWPRTRLVTELKRLLDISRVVVIPVEPGDIFGHADGVMRFVDSHNVLVNCYGDFDRGFRRDLLGVLTEARLSFVEVPYSPSEVIEQGVPSAFGNYMNFLRVGSLIVMPTFGIQEDDLALQVLRSTFPNCRVTTLAAEGLAREGGLLNCCTWTTRDHRNT